MEKALKEKAKIEEEEAHGEGDEFTCALISLSFIFLQGSRPPTTKMMKVQ